MGELVNLDTTPMGSAAEWHEFLDEFRSFGGRAENVMQRKGKFGMGIFPIDSSKPIDLFVPLELLVPTDNIELRDEQVAIKDDQNFPEGYSDWFLKYQKNYSWGAEGKESTLSFEKGLKALPENIQNMLQSYGLYNPEVRFPEEDINEEILKRFINTRCINFKNKTVIMPIIDLVNHAPTSNPYSINDEGIAISGTYDGEVLVRYNIMDPIRRLFNYGFNAQEMTGFSLRCRFQHQDHTVIVQGGQSKSPMQPCKVIFKEDKLIVQQPLLGSLRTPKLPRTLFVQACDEVEGVNAHELFDQIQQFNTAAFVNIIRELEEVDTETSSFLRTACLNQIVSQSHYFGIREDILNKE